MFEAQSGALPGRASVDDFVTIATPFAHTMMEVDDELRRGTWPTPVLPAIEAQLAASQSLIADLVGTTDVTLILSLWRQQIVAAAHKVGSTEHRVSVDLGLATPTGR